MDGETSFIEDTIYPLPSPYGISSPPHTVYLSPLTYDMPLSSDVQYSPLPQLAIYSPPSTYDMPPSVNIDTRSFPVSSDQSYPKVDDRGQNIPVVSLPFTAVSYLDFPNPTSRSFLSRLDPSLSHNHALRSTP